MSSRQAIARNYSQATENRIHSDDVARRFGFEGALVPGVAVFGHLTRPLVERFGPTWLGGSVNTTRFYKPAYDGDEITIESSQENETHVVQAFNAAGTLLADLRATLPEELPAPQDQAVFDAPPRTAVRAEIEWDAISEGEPFPEWHFQVIEDENQRYAQEIDDPLPIYRHVAHPHWLLSVANDTLTREYIMPAWVHVGSEIRFRDVVKVGDTLAVNAVPIEKWERKGHQFVKLYITYHRLGVLTTEILHTAIFRLAGA